MAQLGKDEYFSFSVLVQNNGAQPLAWEQAWVTVDGGEPWRWGKGTVRPSQRVRLKIAWSNMKTCMTPGVHTAVWYFDGRAVHRQRFVLTRNMKWEAVFPIPSGREIANYRNVYRRRSPYLSAWLDIPAQTRYTEYKIDFRAAHLPRGTYCCLGTWTMDHSDLKKRFASVVTDGWAHAYAGFQRLADGQMASIMSFWDVDCRDSAGRKTTIRAERIYPSTVVGGGSFGGEGTGARSIAPFDWEAGHWYRMHLKCIASREKTLVEQWVTDLETEKQTLLCRYDIGVPNSAFVGSISVFLENFLPETAGEVRSMEVRGAEYRNAGTGKWQAVTNAYVTSQGGAPQYEGSYNFGVSENRIWMITSGVGGDWFQNGKGKKGTHFKLPGK